MRAKDYTGERFGKLVAMERKRENKHTYYLCKCDCGKEKWIFSGSLTNNKTKSCGCERVRIAKEERDRIQSSNLVENTSISLISRSEPYKNNKSGVKGVCWDKTKGKWKATIRFKNTQYSLGNYDTIVEAAQARKVAEDKLFGEFLKWYHNDCKKQIKR